MKRRVAVGVSFVASLLLSGCEDVRETRIAFVTPVAYAGGEILSVGNADAICRREAEAAGLPGADSAGSYLAWLAGPEEGTAPVDRFTLRDDIDYVTSDGTVFAHGWSGLSSGVLLAPLTLGPTGRRFVPGDEYFAVWSNVTSTGARVEGTARIDCEGWSSSRFDREGRAGYAGALQHNWTSYLYSRCDYALPFYCFQQ